MISTIEKGAVRCIDESALEIFKGSIRGTLVTSAGSSYNDERSVYNWMIDRHPVLIVKEGLFSLNQNVNPN